MITLSTFDSYMIPNIPINMVALETVLSLNKFISFLSKCNYEYKIFDEPNSLYDEINIGGPICNKKVNSYITTCFPNFKMVFFSNEKTLNDTLSINQAFIEYSKKEMGFKIYSKSNGNLLHYYRIDKKYIDYVFLIKLTPTDFSNTFNKTVHILFSGFSMAISFIPDFIQKYSKDIYKEFGNKHYFIAIPFNNIDNTFDLFTGIINLTDEMFK